MVKKASIFLLLALATVSSGAKTFFAPKNQYEVKIVRPLDRLFNCGL